MYGTCMYVHVHLHVLLPVGGAYRAGHRIVESYADELPLRGCKLMGTPFFAQAAAMQLCSLRCSPSTTSWPPRRLAVSMHTLRR